MDVVKTREVKVVEKGTFKGRKYWITEHNLGSYPHFPALQSKWYCGYVEYEPTCEHDSKDFDVFGGITFVGKINSLGFDDQNINVIGFDTAHYNGEAMGLKATKEEVISLIDQMNSLKFDEGTDNNGENNN